MPESSWRFFLTFMVAAAEVLVGAASSPLGSFASVGAASSLRPS